LRLFITRKHEEIITHSVSDNIKPRDRPAGQIVEIFWMTVRDNFFVPNINIPRSRKPQHVAEAAGNKDDDESRRRRRTRHDV
jgi:hypothetical protein